MSFDLEYRRSELRERLGELSADPELTDEQAAELDSLTAEYKRTEKQLRAKMAISALAETPRKDDAQTLVKRAALGEYVKAIIEQRQADGAERELRNELGLADDYIPTAMLAEPQIETRADANAGAPSDADRMVNQILPRVFESTVANRLGIRPTSVPVGEASFVVTSGGVSPTVVAKNTSKDSQAGTWATTTLEPRRLTAAYKFAREDVSRVRNFEAALRRDLNDSFSDAVDDIVLSGSGTAPQPQGIQTAIAAAGDATATVTLASALSTFAGLVDGENSESMRDIHVFCRAAVYAKLASILQTNDSVPATEVLMRNLGSLNVSERLAAGSSNVYSKTLCYANRQGVTHSVLPVWAGMQIVVDSTSNAQAGQITLTAIQLMSFANLRSGNFKHVSFKTA